MWVSRQAYPSYPRAARLRKPRPASSRRGRNEAARCCTNRRHNAQKTEVRSVCYPWHPWYGRSLVIRESLVKNGVAVYRCGLEAGDITSRSLEIPQWMFDRAICCGLRRAERPVVDCAALLRLKALLAATSVASDEMVIEPRHRSSHLEGDADEKAAPLPSRATAGPVPGASDGAGMADLADGGERAGAAPPGPDVADEPGARRRRRDREGRER